ncbi:MAG TPA: hypothetical protein VFV66_26680, partial [Nonomuraea sp.]|nr:hypothetical protein [Nonomuraea sp.]
MARDLTDGFANVAQIDEKVLNRIFSAEFLRLLRHLHTTAYGRELEIWFDTPRLQVTRTGTTGRGALEMSVEMLARLADRWDQAHVTLTARPNLTHEEKQRADGPALIAPVLDFRTVEADAIEVTASEPDYIDPVYRALVVRLKQLSPFPLGPLFPDDGRRFLLREYAVSEEHGRAGILAVLIDDTTGAPLPAPSTMPRRVHGGVLVLVPKETVQQRIGEALKRDGLDRLPKQVPGHSGMRLNSLAIELREGHILISGSVTKEIGPFDTDV